MSDKEGSKIIDLMAALKASLKGVCVVCAGTGKIHGEPCADCDGTGRRKVAP